MLHHFYKILTLILLLFIINTSLKGGNQNRLISDTLNAVHYDLHLDVIDLSAQQISGYTEILMTSYFENTATVFLELLQLDVDSIFVNNEEISGFIHHDPLLEIPLQEAIQPEDTILVRVHYHGYPFHEGWGGFHWAGAFSFNLGVGFVSDPHNLGKAWFPCIDDFHDRATYDFHIRVDEAKMAVCGGELLSEINNGDGTKTFHWHLDNTIPTYLASVAIGDYELVEDTYNGVEREIPILYYVRSSETGLVAGSFVHMHQVMETFEEHFGPYAWNRVGYVSTAIGAMEHATNIAYPYGSINGGLSSEWLYVHELSHMWFGDKVTCASAEDMWINEGWAVYCESLFREDVYGGTSYIDNINDLHTRVLQFCHTSSIYGDGQYFALYGIPAEYTYGNTVYDKGGIVVHTLRGYLGDELFFAGVKGFLEEFAWDYMSSEDLRDYLTVNTGIDMGPFFETWVFTPGFPHYSIDSFNVVPSGDDYMVTLHARQKNKGTDHYSDANRIEVAFMDYGMDYSTRIMEFDGETGSQEFTIPYEPACILVDPNDWICDATTDESHIINTAGDISFSNTFFSLTTEEIADNAFVSVTHNWVAPDSLKTPVPGLRLSDYRYWTVDGIFPEGFSATGKFTYSRSNYLDNTLILSSADSLVILYRANASEDWQGIEFSQLGPWMVGNLYVENLQKGEYTLAVWDASVGNNDQKPTERMPMRLFPNPSDDVFTLEFDLAEQGRLSIYDNSGKLIDDFIVGQGKQSIQWSPVSDIAGIYYVQLFTQDNRVLASDKLIFLR